MKANKLKKVFAITTLAAAMSVTAFAATNPSIPPLPSYPSIPNPSAPPTSGFGGPLNPSTIEGQYDIQQGNNTTASGNASGGSDTPKAPPNDTSNPDISDAVKDCELQDSREAALINVIEIINAQPKVDDLFNNASEAAKGCFAASSQVINLAMEIPTFSPSWSNLGNIIKGNIMKMIAAKQQELIDKGCAIADQALLSAMQPIQDYMAKYNGALGGMTGNFGLDPNAEYDPSKGGIFGQAAEHMKGGINDIQGRLDKDGRTAAEANAAWERQYQEMVKGMDIPNQTPDFNGNANNPPRPPSGTPVPPIWPDDMRSGPNNSRPSSSAPSGTPVPPVWPEDMRSGPNNRRPPSSSNTPAPTPPSSTSNSSPNKPF